MTLGKFNLKLIFVALLLTGISYLLVINQQETLLLIKNVLSWKHLNLSIWLGLSICFFIHYLSIKDNKNHSQGLIYVHFGKFADSAFAIGTYGLASTTSASLLKGIYFQQVLDLEVYFQNFNQVDIYSMLVVCIFLLSYSIYAAITAFINGVTLSQSEKVIPIIE